MATKPALQHWTYDEYARLPDDGNRYEIIAGELYVSPSPRPNHQAVLVPLILSVGPFIQEHGLGTLYPGPVDLLFAATDYLVPDLAFVRTERAGIVSSRGIEGAPDLVVEILSPSTARRDRGLKRERYANFGVPLYWVMDLDRGHIEVFRLARDPHGPAEIVTDTLEWRPVPGGPSVVIPVPFVVGKAPR